MTVKVKTEKWYPDGTDRLSEIGKMNICRETVIGQFIVWQDFVYIVGGLDKLKEYLKSKKTIENVKSFVYQQIGYSNLI